MPARYGAATATWPLQASFMPGSTSAIAAAPTSRPAVHPGVNISQTQGQQIQRLPLVPDLTMAEESPIQTALDANNKRGALDALWTAMNGKDAAKYDTALLDGGKLYNKYGDSSLTAYADSFTDWLDEKLKDPATGMPAADRRDSGKVRSFMNTINVPRSVIKIRVELSNERFGHISNLYSTFRHEWIHVEQMVNAPLEYLSSNDFPAGVSNPSEGNVLAKREVEAYLWQAENLVQTGQINLPLRTWNLYQQINDFWGQTSWRRGDPDRAALFTRVQAAKNNCWQKGIEGFMTQAETAKAAFSTPVTAGEKAAFKEAWKYVEDLWGYKSYRPAAIVRALQARYDALAETEAGFDLEEFRTLITDTQAQLATVNDSGVAYNLLYALTNKWLNADGATRTALEATYKPVAQELWKKTFDILEKDAAENEGRRYGLKRWLGNMLLTGRRGTATLSFIDAATVAAYQARYDALP